MYRQSFVKIYCVLPLPVAEDQTILALMSTWAFKLLLWGRDVRQKGGSIPVAATIRTSQLTIPDSSSERHCRELHYTQS